MQIQFCKLFMYKTGILIKFYSFHFHKLIVPFIFPLWKVRKTIQIKKSEIRADKLFYNVLDIFLNCYLTP